MKPIIECIRDHIMTFPELKDGKLMVDCPVTGHYEDIFFSKRFECRKFRWYSYWHFKSLLSYLLCLQF